jgi:ADP-ribosyltransferase exoenzyme
MDLEPSVAANNAESVAIAGNGNTFGSIDNPLNHHQLTIKTSNRRRRWRKKMKFSLKNMQRALNKYTGDGYREMNRLLRYGTARKKEETKEVIDQLKAYLPHFPITPGPVYRGVRRARDFYNLVPGAIFCDKGFLSTSTRRGTAEGFAKISPGSNYVFVITSHVSGRDVTSFRFAEEETIFPPNTKFMIDEVGDRYVYMREVDPATLPKLRDDEPAVTNTPKVDGNLVKIHDVDPTTLPKPQDDVDPTTLPKPQDDEPPVTTKSLCVPTNVAVSPICCQIRPLVTLAKPRLRGQSIGDDGLGLVCINGRRRSARNQAPLGSVRIKGLRRSARHL